MFEDLENSIVFPAPRWPEGNWEPSGLNQQDCWFPSADGTRLHGWLVRAPHPLATILYCHGNGEHVAWQAELLRLFRDVLHCSMLAWDYRGYGRSDGVPAEKGILEDGKAALEYLAAETGCQPHQLVLMGRSLGGAVAACLASTTPIRGLIIESSFTSIPDVAARHYPLLPVKMMMKTRLPTIEWIAKYRGPLLMSHSPADEIIPFEMGEALFKACPSQNKKFLRLQESGHNEPPPDSYYSEVHRFLSQLSPLE